MALIEHIYLPKNLDEIIIPNKTDILNTINLHISNQDMNLLLIGSSITFKSIALQLIVKKYYNTQNIQNYNNQLEVVNLKYLEFYFDKNGKVSYVLTSGYPDSIRYESRKKLK